MCAWVCVMVASLGGMRSSQPSFLTTPPVEEPVEALYTWRVQADTMELEGQYMCTAVVCQYISTVVVAFVSGPIALLIVPGAISCIMSMIG
jgi:hypothetical protein